MAKNVTRIAKSGESESYAIKDAEARNLISAEVSAREAAVSAEASARTSAINSAVSAEASARETAVSAEATARAAAVSEEASAREAAVLNLNEKLTKNVNIDDTLFSFSGFVNYETGELTPSDQWMTTDYIPVTPGVIYYLSEYTNNSFVCEYTASKIFIIGRVTNNTSSLSLGEVVGSQTAYIRVSNHISKAPYQRINESYAPYSYADYRESIQKRIASLANTLGRLIGPFNFAQGYVIKQDDGSIVDNNLWGTSEYIPVAEGTTYYILNQTSDRFINFYDENKEWISGELQTHSFTTPPNTAFVRISIVIAKEETLYLSENPITNSDVTIHVGPTRSCKTLREAVSISNQQSGITIYVDPGVYDLATEFADVIANHSGKGLMLGNGVHIIFSAGSKVRAVFDSSDRWIYDYFEPFYCGAGDYTIENLDIEAANTRYCVHDDPGLSAGTYIHKYINCRMKYTNTHTDINYVQCIGGGMGDHSTIVIDGGSYQTVTNTGLPSVQDGDPDFAQQPISFHNASSAIADSAVYIKNVYLVDKGYFRFGAYGGSTIPTKLFINGCRTGLPTLVKRENSSAQYDNFELIEWGENVVTSGHWELSENKTVATFVAD